MFSSGSELAKWDTERYIDLYHLFEIGLYHSLQEKLLLLRGRERNLELVEITNSKNVMYLLEALVLLYQKIAPINFS